MPDRHIISAAFSTDGHHIAFGSTAGDVTVFDLAGRNPVDLSAGRVLGFKRNPNGPGIQLLLAEHDFQADPSGTGLLSLSLAGHLSDVNTVAFSSDGQHLVTASEDSTARFWSLGEPSASPVIVNAPTNTNDASTSGEMKRWVSPNGNHALIQDGQNALFLQFELSKSQAYKYARFGEVATAAFSPGGDVLAMVSKAGQIAIVDFSSDKPKILNKVTAHVGDDDQQNPFVSAISVNDDGSRLVLIATQLLLLDLGGGSLDQSEIETGQEIASDAYLTGDGRRLMVHTAAGAVLIWSLPPRDDRRTKFDGAPQRIPSEKFLTHAAVSKDGRLVLATTDGTVFLFDVSSSSISSTLAEHLGSIRSVSLSMDSRFALVVTEDGAVRIWDVAAPHDAAIQLRNFSKSPLTVQLDRGNQHLVTIFEDGAVIRSPIHLGDVSFAAQIGHDLTRCLSQAQRRAFGLVVSGQVSFDSSKINNTVVAPEASGRCPG